MKKSAYLLSGVVGIIIMLSLVHVSVSNNLSTTGINLTQLQEELKAYQKQNALLHEKILASSSLTHISSVASAQGFTNTKGNVYISTPLPLARR